MSKPPKRAGLSFLEDPVPYFVVYGLVITYPWLWYQVILLMFGGGS